MRRSLFILFLLGVFAVAVLSFLRLKPPQVSLANGVTLTVEAIQTGPFEALGKAEESALLRLLRKLPSRLTSFLLPKNPGGKSSGRSYYTDAYQQNSLHLWFSLYENGQPVNNDPYRERIFLADQNGWLYGSYGWADEGTGRFTQPELTCHSFSAFPRWRKELELVIKGEAGETVPDQLILPNPIYMSGPETNWPTQSLPQEIVLNQVVFRLTALENGKTRTLESSVDGKSWREPTRWKATLENQEPNGATDVWHVIRTSYFDNYGNHSLEGFPPRTSSEDPPAWQWNVQSIVCADERSTIASNLFWELPPLTIPSPGEAITLNNTNLNLGPLRLQFGALAGSGITTYTNATWSETKPLESSSRTSGWSSSTTGEGSNRVVTVTLTRSEPHIAFAPELASTNYYYTCQAVDPTTGSRVWLQEREGTAKKPQFRRKYNDPDLLYFSCGALTNDRPYTFILGAHPWRTVDFFIEAP